MKDELIKQMDSFLFKLQDLGEESRKIAEQTIDDAINTYEKKIIDKLPVKTGGLKNSFQKKKLNRGSNYYGYSINFEGENEYGESYAKIANILNSGTSRIAGSHFIDLATRSLKGLTERIEDNIIDNMEVKTNGNNW